MSDKQQALLAYVINLSREFSTGVAREHSYRGHLKALIEEFDSRITAVNEPAHESFGAPDYTIRRGQIPIGGIEAKDVGISLAQTEVGEQMGRYLKAIDNLILTDYCNFRFYKQGQLVNELIIADVQGRQIVPRVEQFESFAAMLTDFLAYHGTTIRSSRQLAELMAGKAQIVREVIYEALKADEHQESSLAGQFKAFKQVLIEDLDHRQFADIYAQTIAYGLFAARLNDSSADTFTRQEAYDLVPASHPFLRKLFKYVATDFDVKTVWAVDSLAEVFRACDVRELMRDFGQESQKHDPMVHFYETFLSEYDPKLRKSRGVWYTPEPVVKFIVRAVDEVLKTEFGLSKGLADTSKVEITVNQQGRKVKKQVHKVQVLDPATGTATFLAEVIKHINGQFVGQEGAWSGYVEQDLLPRLHGFELLMASYAMAHVKLDLLLRQLNYQSSANPRRLGVYLTNSLEEGAKEVNDLFMAQWLSEEAKDAAAVKNDLPIMVVLGNPPYSASSSNRTDYANGLVEKYKVEPGAKRKLDEKKHWLNDDYVKFLALAEDMIAKNGEGIVAMITNNGYLDNASFRGMRWHLAKTFDKICIFDLHGNAKKSEVSPDGSKDENVFDIMQGVSIVIAVKTSNSKKLAEVQYADIYGPRAAKFKALNSNTFRLAPLPLSDNNYFFVPKSTKGKPEYERGITIIDLLPDYVTGIVSGKDRVAMFNTYEDCRDFVERLKTANDQEIKDIWGDFGRGQTAQRIRDDVNSPNGIVVPVSYRPGEIRWTWYTGSACGFLFWPRRKEIMGSLIPLLPSSAEKDVSFLDDFSASPISSYKNIGLVICRQIVGGSWQHALATNKIVDDSYVSNKTRERGYALPLYIYNADGTRTANFDEEKLTELMVNVPEILKQVQDGDAVVVLDYIYAVLHSPTYRERYKEFLKIDFPKVPIPKNTQEFRSLVELGKQLRELHLMTSSVVDGYDTTYPVTGSDIVEKLKYESGKVYFNDTQYFGNVPEIAWNFWIGGYQPAQKWLKDRKGRVLSNADIDHYQKIIKVLAETDRIMNQIDQTWKL